MSLWNSSSRLARESSVSNAKSTRRSDLWVRDSIQNGGFFDWNSSPADWLVGPRKRLAVLPSLFRSTRFNLDDARSDLLVAKLDANGDLETLNDVRISLPEDDSNNAVVNFECDGSSDSLSVPLDLTSASELFGDKLKELVAND